MTKNLKNWVSKLTLTVFAAGALLASGTIANAADVYKSDQGHTEIIFGWNHAGVSLQHGEFTTSEMILSLDPDSLANSTVTATIDINSISTGVEALDKHLKSADFFEAEKHPTATFTSKSITETGDNTADVVGDITVHGVTKEITLKAKLTHKGEHPVGKFLDYYAGNWIAFSATGTIKHLEFSIGSFPAGPTDEITIEINTEMKQQ